MVLVIFLLQECYYTQRFSVKCKTSAGKLNKVQQSNYAYGGAADATGFPFECDLELRQDPLAPFLERRFFYFGYMCVGFNDDQAPMSFVLGKEICELPYTMYVPSRQEQNLVFRHGMENKVRVMF